MEQVKHAAAALRSFREPDAHLSSATARKLRGLIHAAQSPLQGVGLPPPLATHALGGCCTPVTMENPFGSTTSFAHAPGAETSMADTLGRSAWSGEAPFTVAPLDTSSPAHSPTWRSAACALHGASHVVSTRAHDATGAQLCLPAPWMTPSVGTGGSAPVGQGPCCSDVEAPTMLVDKVATWKRRRDAALRCRPGCRVHRAIQQAAYLVARQQQTAAGHVRLFRVDGSGAQEELELGKSYEDFRTGFAVAATPEAAIERAPRRAVCAGAMVAVKCIANGMGYMSGNALFVPCVRPVCVMDFVSTEAGSGGMGG